MRPAPALALPRISVTLTTECIDPVKQEYDFSVRIFYETPDALDSWFACLGTLGEGTQAILDLDHRLSLLRDIHGNFVTLLRGLVLPKTGR